MLGDLLRYRKPDFIFLSKTISLGSKIELLCIKFSFAKCFAVDCIGRSDGLAVLWKSHVPCQVSGYSQNHIDIQFNENNMAAWRMTCFYGLLERSRRKVS